MPAPVPVQQTAQRALTAAEMAAVVVFVKKEAEEAMPGLEVMDHLF